MLFHHRNPVCFAVGKDASEDFDEIGHSKSAREMLAQYKIGKFKVIQLRRPVMTGCNWHPDAVFRWNRKDISSHSTFGRAKVV